MSDFICPYCFIKSDANEVFFQCRNPSCLSPDPEFSARDLDIPVSQLHESQIQSCQTVFKARSPGLLARMFGVKNPFSAICPDCDTPTSIRVCPECHSPFPCGVDNLSNLMIAVVGAKETGKSHYIAVLIQRIRSLYNSFGWTLSAIDDETMNLYKNHFYNPLYASVPPRTLEVTQSARGNAIVRKPLLYSLSMTKGKRSQTITLAFFDTAGEDMDDERQMHVINPYIYNASGIILLLDPLQLPKVRNRPEFSSISLPQAKNAYVGDIVNRIANLVRSGRKLTRDEKIPIPLAVAFSKIDLMRNILGESSLVYQKSCHRGQLSLREFGAISGNIKDWIDEYDSQMAFVQQTVEFADTGFFGVSALGGNPDRNGVLPFTPRPIRVEDPFLWLLWKNHFIKGNKS